MHAIKVSVDILDHRLPADVLTSLPNGRAEIIVLYETEEVKTDQALSLHDFFQQLDQRPPTQPMTREEADRYLINERDSWGA